jgi:23S rRNA G2069 N7-methylase RlmK/C1962 C5-methylase RlmI
MDGTFDIQRDHAALLDDVLAVCSGVVWFSTNRRRFRLALEVDDPRDATRGPLSIEPTVAIADHTHTTIPPDFRDRKIHHAYRIARR